MNGCAAAGDAAAHSRQKTIVMRMTFPLALLHVLAFEAAELSQQGNGRRLRDGQLGKGGFAQRDVERGESLVGFDVQLGAAIDEKLHDSVRAALRGSVQRSRATGVPGLQGE